jgi:hypothetical protein
MNVFFCRQNHADVAICSQRCQSLLLDFGALDLLGWRRKKKAVALAA